LTLETLLQIDSKIWPFAALLFFRILICLVFLPLFSDNAVNLRIRIVLSMAIAFLIWPVVSLEFQKQEQIDISAIGIFLGVLRETFFGFTVGTCGKILTNAANIASHMVGVGMGFQTASMLNPQTGAMEDAFTTLKTWIMVLLMFTFKVHHIFIEEIVNSFYSVPLMFSISPNSILNTAISCVKSSFSLGIRIGAPILIAQVLITFAIGIINRAIPQLNAMVIQFPISFLVSMGIFLFSIAGIIQLVGTQGVYSEHESLRTAIQGFILKIQPR
jgi:flagellar biosynthesis protein FliR